MHVERSGTRCMKSVACASADMTEWKAAVNYSVHMTYGWDVPKEGEEIGK